MPRCYQMVGIPASGKTTWISNQDWLDKHVIVSTDEFVEKYAKENNKNYSEVFEEYMPTAINLMLEKIAEARDAGLDIVWDQTSTTIASRARKFRVLPNYDHIAVVFEKPSDAELMRRLNNRPGKTIPWPIVADMIENFEMPSINEGFQEIWNAS